MPPPFAVQDGDKPEVTLFSIDRVGNVTVVGTLTVQGQLVASAGLGSTTIVVGASTNGIAVQESGDTAPRFAVTGDGVLHWGPGNGAVDTQLSRNGAGNLSMPGSFSANSNISATGNIATASGDINTARHFLGSSASAPGAAAGAGAGTSPPAPVVAATANDTRGSLTWGTGTTPAAGNQVAVTFATAYAAAPVVMLTETNAVTSALAPYVTSVGTTGFTIATQGAPAASQGNTTYGIAWMVIG
jgi:hypothetical protein